MPFLLRSIPQCPAFYAMRTHLAALCLVLIGMLVQGNAVGAQLTFAWDYPPATAKGFYLYCGTASGVHSTKVDVGNVTTTTLTGLTEGTRYYCAVTAYDGDKVESGKSGELVVTVPYAAPVAGFSMTSASGTAPLTVRFTSASTGNVTSYFWDFGNGATSTQQNPTHVYSTAGIRRITLTVTGPGGSSTKTALINVAAPAAPVANFTMTPPFGMAPLSVAFTNASTGSTSYSWNFGDGTPTSSQANPTHVYRNPGTYTITLTATGPGGTNTKTYVATSLVRLASGKDFDGDGISDLVLSDSNNVIGVWSANAAGAFKRWREINNSVSFGSWVVVGLGDFNRDGIQDLLIENDGYIAAWCPDASGIFKQWIPMNGGAPFGSWVVIGAADYNGDAIPDLMMQNGGYVAAWCPDASGLFKEWIPLNAGASFAPWSVIGIGDFNRDGIPDLVVQDGGYTAVWSPDAKGNFKAWIPLNSGASFGTWTIVGVGEFNRDGIPDLLIYSGTYTAAWCPDASGTYKQWIPLNGGAPFSQWTD